MCECLCLVVHGAVGQKQANKQKQQKNKNRLLYPFAWGGSHVIAWLLTCCQISSQNPLPLFTVMALYMYPKHADMSMHSNLKTARNSLLLKLSNHTKGTTNFAKNKVGR